MLVNKTKSRGKIHRLIWITLLGIIAWGFINYYVNGGKSFVTADQIWDTKLDINYKDEPDFDESKTQLSIWTIPSDPDVIRPIKFTDPLKNLLGGIHTTELTQDELNDIWKESDIDRLNTFISKHKLEQTYYDYFYASVRTPLALDYADITGDGVDEEIFVSSGVGCASCHPIFIDIINDEIQYETVVNKGGITPRDDGMGFYLDNQYTGDEFATCCADNVILSRYEWNGKGFTETARKRVDF